MFSKLWCFWSMYWYIESWGCLSNWLIIGKGEQGPSYFPLYLQSNRGMRNKGRMREFLLIHSLLRAFFCDSLIPIFPYTKTIMISFPHSQTLPWRSWHQVVVSWGEGGEVRDGWCLHTLVCTSDCFGWVSVSYPGGIVTVSTRFILLY